MAEGSQQPGAALHAMSNIIVKGKSTADYFHKICLKGGKLVSCSYLCARVFTMADFLRIAIGCHSGFSCHTPHDPNNIHFRPNSLQLDLVYLNCNVKIYWIVLEFRYI